MRFKNRYIDKDDIKEFRILKMKHYFILIFLKISKKYEDNTVISKFIPKILKTVSKNYFENLVVEDKSMPMGVKLILNSLIFTDFIKLETIKSLRKDIISFINKNFEVDFFSQIPINELKEFENSIKRKPFINSSLSLGSYKVKADSDLFKYAEHIKLNLEYITGDIVFITFSVIPSINIINDYNEKLAKNHSKDLLNFELYKFKKIKIYFDHYIFSKEKILLDYKREVSWMVLKKLNKSTNTYLFNNKIEPDIIEVFQTNDLLLFEKDYFDFLHSIGIYSPNLLGFKDENMTFYYDGENTSNSKVLVSEKIDRTGFSSFDETIFLSANLFLKRISSTLAINSYLYRNTLKINDYQNKLMKLLNKKYFVHNKIIRILTDLNIETNLISRFDFYFSIILKDKGITSHKSKYTTIHITQEILYSTLNKIEMIIKMTNSRLEVENVKSTKKLSRRAIWISIISTLIALSSTYGSASIKWLDILMNKVISFFN